MADDEDNDLYELAEDPEEPRSPPPSAPDPRLGGAGAEGRDEPAPAGDLLPDPDDGPGKMGKSAEGGEGASSHFKGDDPEYVNPEVARIRREDQRRAAAAEEAEEAAAKQKLYLIVAGVVVALVVVLWFLFFR